MNSGLLDHLYLMRQMLVGPNVNSIVKIIYFSDHHAVKVHIQKENRETKDIDFTIS